MHRIKKLSVTAMCRRIENAKKKNALSSGFFVWLAIGFPFRIAKMHTERCVRTKWHKIDYNQIFRIRNIPSDFHSFHISVDWTSSLSLSTPSVSFLLHLMSTWANEWCRILNWWRDGYTNTRAEHIALCHQPWDTYTHYTTTQPNTDNNNT